MEEEQDSPYDMGYHSGYYDEQPGCPFEEGTKEAESWWEGYKEGSWQS